MHETRRQEIADIDTTIAELQALARHDARYALPRINELCARRAYLVKAAKAAGELREYSVLEWVDAA